MLLLISLVLVSLNITRGQQCIPDGDISVTTNFCSDLQTWVNLDDGSQQLLQAYQTETNQSSTCQYWLTVGTLQLLPTVVYYSSGQLATVSTFVFAPSGFSFALQLATQSDKQALADAASRKYTQLINANQFLQLPVTSLLCQMTLEDEDSMEKFTVFGQANDFSQQSVDVHFDLPLSNEERRPIERLLQQWNSPELLQSPRDSDFEQLTCHAEYHESATTENLSLFGEAYEQGTLFYLSQFLTRKQFSMFAMQVHSLFQVGDRFRLSQSAFRELLQAQLTRLGALGSLETVQVSEALSGLSTLGRSECPFENSFGRGFLTCSAAEMLSDLSSVLQLASNNYTVAFRSDLLISQKLHGAFYLDVLRLGDGDVFANNYLVTNLSELNSNASDVIWSVRNQRLVPDSLRLLPINRSALWNLTLANISRLEYNSLFSQKVSLTFTKSKILRKTLSKSAKTGENKANFSQFGGNVAIKYGSTDQRLGFLAQLKGFVAVSRCVLADKLKQKVYEDVSLKECQEFFDLESNAAGFNYYITNDQFFQEGNCEFISAISGHTFAAQSAIDANCSFYYKPCTGWNVSDASGRIFYTYSGVRNALDARSQCANKGQHLLEIRNPNELLTINTTCNGDFCHLNGISQSEQFDEFVWSSDESVIDFSQLGRNASQWKSGVGKLFLAAKLSGVGEYVYSFTEATQYAITICQCNEYRLW